MAVRPLLIVAGQSQMSPSGDFAGWLANHIELDLRAAPLLTSGSYSDRFQMPDAFPGFASPLNLQGIAFSGVRYLTAYHPQASGYRDYPGVGRVVSAGTAAANAATDFWVEQEFTAGAVPTVVSITRVRTGEVRAITGVSTAGRPAGAGCRLTVSAFASVPDVGENFTYQIRCVGGTASLNTVQLSNKFGASTVIGDGTIVGMEIDISGTGTDVRRITGWSNVSATATFDGAAASITNGTLLTLSPPGAVTFDRWSYFLPACWWEGDQSDALLPGRVNPYPPGFNWPNYYHVLPEFRAVRAAAATAGLTNATTGFPNLFAVHFGLGIRLNERLHQPLYILDADFGGTALVRSEFPVGSGAMGWFDPSQQNHWTSGATNNCLARLLDELDMAIAAAALEGDTLDVIGIVFAQGEADALSEQFASRYESNLRELKARLRAEIKARSLTSRPADRIPWVQPKIKTLHAFSAKVNDAIVELTAEDRYMRTLEVEDIAVMPDGLHHSGAGIVVFEGRLYDALVSLFRDTAATGEVELCNLALRNIGDAGLVTAIDPPDGSAQAEHCAAYYATARDTVLTDTRWSFACTRVSPRAIEASPSSTWAYAYLMPADSLQPFAVLLPGASDDYVEARWQANPWDPPPEYTPGGVSTQPFAVETTATGRQVLLTNVPDAVVRYVQRVTDTTRFPPGFRNALSWYLASMLAPPIVKGAEGMRLAAECLRRYGLEFNRAGSTDAGKRQLDLRRRHVPPWIRAHHG